MNDTGAGRRRLAAVWFADVVGYTRLSAEDEDAALRVVSELQRIATVATEAKDGRVVKFIGDAVMTVFDSVDSALGAALATVSAFEASDAVQAHDVAIRVGLHLGEVVEAPDGDVYGDGVNVASRVEGAAEPGRVTVTGSVAQLIRNRPMYAVTALEERTLKGIADPVVLYEVSLAGATSNPSRSADPAARRRPGRAVGAGTGAAVLTFLFLSVMVAQKAPELGDWGAEPPEASAGEAATPVASGDSAGGGGDAPPAEAGGEPSAATTSGTAPAGGAPGDPSSPPSTLAPSGGTPAPSGGAARSADRTQDATEPAARSAASSDLDETGPSTASGPGPAVGSASRTGAWRVDEGVDPLTDAPFVTLSLPATQGGGELRVRCRDGRLAVELGWNTPLADGSIRVREGGGRDRDARSQWTLLPDSSGLAYRGDPRRFLRELEGAGTWVAAVDAGRDRAVAVFEVVGLGAGADRLQAASCR